MISIDTNVFYSVLVKTEFSLAARNIIMMPSKLATSAHREQFQEQISEHLSGLAQLFLRALHILIP